MATWYEARTCAKNPDARSELGARPTLAAIALAELCATTLFADGPAAVEAVSRREVTSALEHVVEANTLLSGIGFESGGLAAADAIAHGCTTLPEVHRHFLHGEMVAIGVLIQLVPEGDEAEARRVAEFFARVGLPIHFGQLGVSIDDSTSADRVMQQAALLGFVGNEPLRITPAVLLAASERADEIGREIAGKIGDSATMYTRSSAGSPGPRPVARVALVEPITKRQSEVSMPEFVNLHVRSDYSLRDSIVRVEELIEAVCNLGVPSVALTDLGTLSGIPKLLRRRRSSFIKPIRGCEVNVRFGDGAIAPTVLLARNEDGYRDLVRIVSASANPGRHARSVDLATLAELSADLFGTSGSAGGAIAAALGHGADTQARELAESLAKAFPSDAFHLVLTGYPRFGASEPGMLDLNAATFDLAERLGLPTLAVNDVRYILREDADVQRAWGESRGFGASAQSDPAAGQLDFFTCSEQGGHLLSMAEIAESPLAQYPAAVSRANEIASQCQLPADECRLYPPPPVRPPDEDAYEALVELCRVSAEEKYGSPLPSSVAKRLQAELAYAEQAAMAECFLFWWDLVKWARAEGPLTGPGRGSAPSLLLLYLLGVTEIDPLEYGLRFERAISLSTPYLLRVYLETELNGEAQFVDHLRAKYGDDHVARTICYRRLRGHDTLRAACAIEGSSAITCARVSQVVACRTSWRATFQTTGADGRALLQLCEQDAAAESLVRVAQLLDGLIDSRGPRADWWSPPSVVVTWASVGSIIPVERDAVGKELICQYEGYQAEILGAFAASFHELNALTVIARALATVRQRHGQALLLDRIPRDDRATYRLLNSGATGGVIGLGTPEASALVARVQPKSLRHLSAIIALGRIGPMKSGLTDEYVRRRHEESRDPDDPLLTPILAETYGLFVYQEQVMDAAVAFGIAPEKTDELRKAIGKMKQARIEEFRQEFMARTTVSHKRAANAWKRIAESEYYTFNKAHSISHALLAYRCAYLKTHWPTEFLEAYRTVLGEETYWAVEDIM